MKTTQSPRAVADAAPPAQGDGTVVSGNLHIFDRLAALYRYRFFALAVFGIVVILMMTATYTTVPQYKASARLLIEEERSALSDFKDGYLAYVDPEPFYQTQYRILKGRDLARRAVRRLRLDAVPEFNGTAPAPVSVSGLLLTAPRAAVSAVKRLALGERPAPASAPKAVDEDALIAGFLGRVDVQPVANSRLVDVFFHSADAAFAALAVNTLAEEYVQQNLEFKLQTTEKSLIWVSEEVVRQQKKVEESEQALADYREQQNALSLESRQNIVVSRLNQLNDALTRAKTTRVQKEALYNAFHGAGAKSATDKLPAIEQSPFVQTLRARLADLQRDKVRLSARYGELHPEIIKVNAAIDDANSQIEAESAKALDIIRTEYQLAVAEERTLAAALDEQKRAAMDLNRKGVSYTVLEREAQSNRQVYEALLQREKELRVVSNSRGNNVRLLDRGEQPKAPFTPQPRRDWLAAIGLGLVIAAAAALGLDYLNDTIRTPEDISTVLGLPALGYVPAVRGARPTFAGSGYDLFSEALRMLRTSCVTMYEGKTPRVIMITSAQPLEGKTTTSCNLALALAYGGARVLLIDADLRRPNLHRVLDVPNGRGLADLLAGSATPREATQQTEIRNLVVMTSGRVPPNPSELLASARMQTLLSHLRDGPFDWIIVDTPPVLAVTDSMVVAPLVDGVLLVIGSDMTRRSLAERAVESLVRSNPGPLAAVLNKVDLRRDKYYYSKRYGYKTTSYYAEAV